MKQLYLLIFTVVITTCFAQTSYIWNGNISTNWNTNTNWTPNGIPGASDNVTIVPGANNCILSANTTITNLTITNGVLNLNSFTLTTTGVVACNNGTCTSGTFNSTATSLTFAGTLFNSTITANVTEVYFNGSVFNGNVSVSKNGAANAQSNGNNTFNGPTSITNAGTGYLMLTNGSAGRIDVFNGATTLNTTNTGNLYVGYGRNININANLTVNNTASTGSIFLGNTGAVNLNSGILINCGTFAGGSLNINKLIQTGSTPLNLSPGIAGGVNITGSTINGSLTVNAGIISAQTSTFAAAVSYSVGGTIINTWSAGGNTYNGVLTVNNSSSGYIGFGNGTPDIYNADVYANNTSSTGGRIIFGNSSNNQFNGNIYLSASGTTAASGIALGWGGTHPIIKLAATKSIFINGAYSSGYLQINRLEQADATPLNLTTTGTSEVRLQQNIFTGPVNVTAPDIIPQGGTYNAPVSFIKTGGTTGNHNNGNVNIFNSTLNIENQSNTGYLLLSYNSTDLFNDNITISSTGTGGISLGWNGGTGTPVLAAGKTISIGAGGFSTGYFQLGSFTQLGNTPITLSMTGDASFHVVNSSIPCTFGGALNVTAADLYIRGGTFNGPTVFTKTAGSDNHNNGSLNIFNSTLEINQQSTTGYIMLGYNSADEFNDNITITNTGTRAINLGWSGGTGTPTLASGKTILLGAAGFTGGSLYFGGFTQLGNAAINLPFSGTTTMLSFRASLFGGNFTSTSGGYNLNGSIFNGTFSATKTGASNDACPGGNTFNGTSEFINNGNGYFMFGNGSPDIWNGDVTFTNTGAERILPCWSSTGNQFNGNMTLNSFGSSVGINFCGGNATSTATLAASKSLQVGVGGYSSGYLILQRFTSLNASSINLPLTSTANYLQFGPSSSLGGNVTSTSPGLYFHGCVFGGITNCTKTGSSSDNSNGGNTFNGVSAIINNGSGYLLLGNGTADTWNNDVTFTNTGIDRILLCYNSTGNIFNGNITLNSTGSSTGINFCAAAASTATMSAGHTINTGTFDKGYLILQRFTQLGNVAVNLNLTSTSNYLQYGPGSALGGNVTSTSPGLFFHGCTFNGTTDCIKTGTTGDYSNGGNIFNGVSTITNNGTSFLLLGNTSPDIWNNDVTFTNNSTERILPAWATVGNLFNGNIYVNTTGSAQGIQFCGGNATATATLAATKTIAAGSLGLNAGYLQLRQFTQLGTAPINLTLTATASYLQFGPLSNLGGNVTSVSPRLYFNGCTFNGTTNCIKNGAVDDDSNGSNTFVGASTITNYGSGRILLGNASIDAFLTTATFNNYGSAHMFVAHNSTNNSFGGVTTFNNAPSTPTAGVYVSGYSTGTVFNDNIVVTNVNGNGVQFCHANATATSTLVAGKTISIGPAGFNSGILLLKQFTQLGPTPQSFTTTGTSSIIQYGPLSSFGGNVTSVSPRLYFNGCTFNGTTNCTKNGATDDDSNGSNTFVGASTITNYGSGRILLGNASTDAFMSTANFNNLGTNHMYIAHNSANNVFGGVTTFSNAPTGNYAIYVSGYSTGTVFNDNIIVSNVNGAGVQFCYANATATSTLATGKTITIGPAGFNTGTLLLKQFTQLGPTAQTLSITTGNALLQLGPLSAFNGNVDFSFPQVLLHGATYNSAANITKNGATDNSGNGGNVFNGTTTLTNSGSGNLITGNVSSDLFNGVTTINNTGSNRIYFAHNHTGQTTTFTQPLTLNGAKTGGTDGWTYLIGEGNNLNVVFNDVTINLSGNLQSNLRILQGTNTTATYNGNLTVNLTNTNASGTQVQLGNTGNSVYNGNIILNSTTGVTGSGVYFNAGATASSTLASTKSIGLGGSGFTSGNLSMIRFTQLGTATQSIVQTTGNAVLTSGPTNVFNGPVNFNFPQVYLQGAVYNNTATIEKNGAADNVCSGGNSFNDVTTITNSSANYLRLANATADNYNADVTMVQSNTGVLAPNYNTNSTYSGNITVTSPAATAITFGANTNGIATLTGGSAQTINRTGSSAFPVFRRLVVDKPANNVTLNTKIFVSAALTLTQGLVNTTATNILHITNAATSTLGNATSFINGPMNYDMALNGARTLTFPIGKVSDWRPAVLTLTHNNATSYTYFAELTNASAQALGWTLPPTVTHVSLTHYWDIIRSNTSTSVVTPTTHLSGNQTITLYYDTNDGVTDPTKLTICKNTYTAGTTWIDIGGTGASMTAGSVSSTSAPSAFSSFSRFTLSNLINGTNPLPIELLYFTATPADNTVSLDWATATEQNNSHFEIERSIDGINFEYLTTVNAYGNGTSVVKQVYNTADNNPYKGISYYRLKQLDKTGEFAYAGIVSVEFAGESFINLYPNPTSGVLNLKATTDYDNASIKIINALGVEVKLNTSVKTFNGMIDLSDLASGIYYAVIENGNKTENIKISIQK